jgi:hypothetical protein
MSLETDANAVETAAGDLSTLTADVATLKTKYASIVVEFDALASKYNTLVAQLVAKGTVIEADAVTYVAKEEGIFKHFLSKAKVFLQTAKSDLDSEITHLFHKTPAVATPAPADASGAGATIASGSTPTTTAPATDTAASEVRQENAETLRDEAIEHADATFAESGNGGTPPKIP